eukprot:CAMPEP_0113326884 /NCGR_PEP_ID=MMETSP0010_2-20120614/18860_1 /TAXON_ID=216773 ORGANISM="Corethron hystrix, Strain 308" /NCGR_SAMPLE_ID=MMETSP0010_2 /ASSEMBLY_ACC=CAM_ASM_000155 /LENGTH=171 /DNA_ID=CAMNT_0000187447 /DNA_START=220 /DNA_END=737 /DNA_ORIENTATION=- /assembly_acc=CAM_ASM_000155
MAAALTLRLHVCHPSYDLHALHDLTEGDVFPVQMRRPPERNEKLTSVGIPPSIRHAHDPRTVVRPAKIFIGKGCAVSRISSRSVEMFEVAPLHHKSGKDAMKFRTAVVGCGRVSEEVEVVSRLIRGAIDGRVTEWGEAQRAAKLPQVVGQWLTSSWITTLRGADPATDIRR